MAYPAAYAGQGGKLRLTPRRGPRPPAPPPDAVSFGVSHNLLFWSGYGQSSTSEPDYNRSRALQRQAHDPRQEDHGSDGPWIPGGRGEPGRDPPAVSVS